jgi:hypothetical protein
LYSIIVKCSCPGNIFIYIIRFGTTSLLIPDILTQLINKIISWINIKLFGFIVLTVLFMQITFFTMIVKEQYKLDNFAAIFLILLLSLTLLFGYKYFWLTSWRICIWKFTVALWVPVGAVMCYLLNLLWLWERYICRNYRYIGIVFTLHKQGVVLFKTATSCYLLWCIRRYVERSNYTFYCSGRRRWNFSGLVFYVIKNLFVGGGKLEV